MKELFQKLEAALLNRNPDLTEKLQDGLPVEKIKQDLEQAGIKGEIAPIIEFYSWRNGTTTDQSSMEEISFFPVDIYWFLDLKSAIEQFDTINKAAEQLKELTLDDSEETQAMFSDFQGQYFPLFFNGVTGTIAIDLSSKENRVVAIEFESTEPVRQAYASFEDFLNDAVKANEEECNLSCFGG